jgi:hypothetical protein
VVQDESKRIACVSNLKQLGLAARVYATDHGDVFPSAVGVMSNEVSVTKVLVCPSDPGHSPAPSWGEFDPAAHMSYEYSGASAREDYPQTVLFRCPIHGHVALADGSVQQGRGGQQAVTPQAVDMLRRRYGVGEMPEVMRERYGLGSGPQPGKTLAEVWGTIINNLRSIDGAKEQWALESRPPQGARPTESDIAAYLRRGFPEPVAGEQYEIGAVDQLAAAVLSRPIGPGKAGDRITVEQVVERDQRVLDFMRAKRDAAGTVPGSDGPTVTSITITRDGTLMLDGEPLDVDQLAAKLKERPEEFRSRTTVTIHTNEEVEFSRVMSVIEACQEAGVSSFNLLRTK